MNQYWQDCTQAKKFFLQIIELPQILKVTFYLTGKRGGEEKQAICHLLTEFFKSFIECPNSKSIYAQILFMQNMKINITGV